MLCSHKTEFNFGEFSFWRKRTNLLNNKQTKTKNRNSLFLLRTAQIGNDSINLIVDDGKFGEEAKLIYYFWHIQTHAYTLINIGTFSMLEIGICNLTNNLLCDKNQEAKHLFHGINN